MSRCSNLLIDLLTRLREPPRNRVEKRFRARFDERET